MQQMNEYISGNIGLFLSRLICMGILAWLSVTDIKRRRIPETVLIFGSVIATGYVILVGGGHIGLAAGGLLIGFMFVIISKVTGEQLGYGDSWLLCILGEYLGIWNLLVLLFTAWLAVALAAMAALAGRRFRRRTELPMIPFITVGYMVMWAEEMLL